MAVKSVWFVAVTARFISSIAIGIPMLPIIMWALRMRNAISRAVLLQERQIQKIRYSNRMAVQTHVSLLIA